MLSKRSIFIAVACSLFSINGPLFAAPTKDAMTWSDDLASAQQEAMRSGKLILVHFSGENCPPCARVQKNVFSQPTVSYQISTRFVSVQINGSAQPHIARQFQVTNWPTDLILTADGQELHRMISPQDPRTYLAELGKAAWRAQSIVPGAQIATQRQTPSGQVGLQSVPQQSVPQQRVPQQNVPQPAAVAQKPITQAINRAQALTRAQIQPGYQAPLLAPRGTVGQSSAATQPVAPTQPAAAQRAYAVQNAFASTSNTNRQSIAPASAVATMPQTSPRPVAQAAAQSGTNQAPTTPAQPVADLYPQAATGHTAVRQQTVLPTVTAPQTKVASCGTSPNRVQPVAYNQPASPKVELPAGVNPFSVEAQRRGGTGSVMLTNPFLTKPVAPQPEIAPALQSAPKYQQPTVQNQAAARPYQALPIQNQPSTVAAQRQARQPELVATAQLAPTSQPTLTVEQSAMAAQPSATAETVQSPTPALTLATPSQNPTITEPAQPIENEVPKQPSDTVGGTQAPSDAAIDGYCSVTLHHEDRWVKGDPRWGAQHRGKVYLFLTAAAQERFLNDPDKYSPLLSGFDPVVFHETGELKAGFRTHGVRYQDMTCLFSSEESLQRFWESPWQFTQTAQQAMRADTTVR